MKREPKQTYTRKQHLTALRVAKWRMKKRHDSEINDANDRFKRMVETALSNRKNALQIVLLLNSDFSLGNLTLAHFTTDYFLKIIREEVTTLKEQIDEEEKIKRELIDGAQLLRKEIISIVIDIKPDMDMDKNEIEMLIFIRNNLELAAARIRRDAMEIHRLNSLIESERTKSGEIIDIQNKNLKSSAAIMQTHLDDLNAAHSNKSIIQFIRDRREWRKAQKAKGKDS